MHNDHPPGGSVSAGWRGAQWSGLIKTYLFDDGHELHHSKPESIIPHQWQTRDFAYSVGLNRV